MDFSFTPEQQELRRELRAFFAEEPVRRELAKLRAAGPRGQMHSHEIHRWLGERGWLAINWPQEYGGLDKTLVESMIVSEEMARHGVPGTVRENTVEIVGLFLLLAGSEEQKRRLLPPMARGEMVAAVLYTEPDAGSDLSSLATRAVADGETYMLFGTKIYNVGTELAQYGMVAARSRGGDNRYDGITLFLVPLEAPGVEVRPQWNITDERFNEVVFDGVCVGPDDVVGVLHEGWQLISTALAIERTGLDFWVKLRHWLELIIDRARSRGRLRDPVIGHQIAALDAELEAGRMLGWKVISSLERGELDEISTGVSKWYNTQLARRIARLGLELEGMDGVLSRWDPESPLDGAFEAAYRISPGMTLAAGTSEIMLYMISALGLEIQESEMGR